MTSLFYNFSLNIRSIKKAKLSFLWLNLHSLAFKCKINFIFVESSIFKNLKKQVANYSEVGYNVLIKNKIITHMFQQLSKPISHKRLTAFTLIELMVVIGIITILGGIIVPGVKKAYNDFYMKKTLVEATILVSACRSYYLVYNEFPADTTAGYIIEDLAQFVPSNLFIFCTSIPIITLYYFRSSFVRYFVIMFTFYHKTFYL